MVSKLSMLAFLFLLLHGSISPLYAKNTNHWETFVYPVDSWKYFVGTTAPPDDWYLPQFDDQQWLTGKGGFGYGDEDDSTLIPHCISVYLRNTFDITDTSVISEGYFHIDYDDAFIAFLNGTEIGRSGGLSEAHPAYDLPSGADHEARMYLGGKPEAFYLSKSILKQLLRQGSNTLSIEVHNTSMASSDLSAIPYLSFGIDTSQVFKTTTPDWLIKVFDSNLPILKINTNGQNIPDEPKITATMQAIFNNKGIRNSYNDSAKNFNGHIGIEVRGSSSQGFDKKGYTMETRNNAGNDSSVNLLGLPVENDWVLYAPYSDKTLMRNVVIYSLGNKIMGYAPRTRFCELFINDDYKGVYVLTEKIKVDKNRVNILKMTNQDNSSDLLTGGYIIQLDRYNAEGFKSNYMSNGFDVNYAYVYPKGTDITPQQKKYIYDYMATCEDSINYSVYTNEQSGYARYLDVASFVDFFLICEFTKNIDAYRLSTYMHKNRDSKGGKLTMGPLWDFDLTFGNADYYYGYNTAGWVLNDVSITDNLPIPFWWNKLLQDTVFQNKLKCRWLYLRDNIIRTDSIFNLIDQNALLLSEAKTRNFETFPIIGVDIWPNYFIGNSYEAEVDYMKNWISDRITWIDNNLPGTCRPPVNVSTSYKNANVWITASPNPFTCNIEFTILQHHTGLLKIDIIDLNGKIIKTLSDHVYGDTPLSIRWLSDNTDGSQISPGMYIYIIRINDQTLKTGKILKVD